MKKLFFLIPFFLFAICAFAQIDKVIASRPNPPRLVNDFTNTLTPEQTHVLENKLVAYDDSTSNQIAIVIIPTLDGNSVEEVALGILRNWGVGSKKNNNGIVILVAKDDHKIRIETGYGLEGRIPDVTARSIIDNDLTPNFRAGNFYRGFDKATDDIIKAAAGEYKASGRKKKGIGLGTIIFLLFIIFGILGSIGGGRNGGMMSRRGYGGFGTGWIIGSMMGRNWGGGGSSGGGWSGGGGGGFGGFGGGGGGGGGASGGW